MWVFTNPKIGKLNNKLSLLGGGLPNVSELDSTSYFVSIGVGADFRLWRRLYLAIDGEVDIGDSGVSGFGMFAGVVWKI